MKKTVIAGTGIARRQAGLPIYQVGQRVKILKDVGRSRKPYGTIAGIQRRRNRVVLVVARDNLPTDTGKGRCHQWEIFTSTAMVTPLYWRGPAKSTRCAKRGPARRSYIPLQPHEIESVRYV